MSAANPNRRKTVKLLGGNVRPGHMPGGFSGSLKSGKGGRLYQRGEPRFSIQRIHDAAAAALRARGIHNRPTSWESTQNKGPDAP
jgi:hypothetical protein